MAQDTYDAGDIVVYPTHGVGEVKGIETQDLGDLSVEVIVIQFDSERMTLRVPTNKAQQSGLRPLSSKKVMDSAITTLRGRAKVRRTMWSRRAQEYEAKINSGDPISIAEVVRDLHRGAHLLHERCDGHVGCRLPITVAHVPLRPILDQQARHFLRAR